MIGEYIQNYQVTAHLGEGGMGTVYKANDTILGREVALKMLHGQLVSQSQFLERFKKEARILAQLLHPNIAVIYNFIEQGGRYYMVMEYVDGENLDTILKKNKTIGYKPVVAMMYHALEGLHHAHRKNICHRDIKPSNLILTSNEELKLMDFGIAKIAGEQKLTQVARVIGTLEYMAPEIIAGKDPSTASDIYALGITMYELLTGRLPFVNKTDYTLMQDIVKKDPVSPDKLNPSIPKALADIIKKAVQKKPEDRFADARSFQQALIAAFPGLTRINLADINRPVTATRLVYSAANGGGAPTVLQDIPSPKTASNTLFSKKFFARNLSSVRSGFRQIPKTQLIIIAGIILAFALFAIFSGVFTKRNTIEALASKKEQSNKGANLQDSLSSQQIATAISTSSSPGGTEPALPEVSRIGTGPKLSPADGTLKPADEALAGTPVKKSANKPVNKPLTTRENGSNPATEKQTDTKNDKEEKTQIAEAKPVAKKQVININSRIRVVLILKDNINADYAKEGQKFRLEVQRPVVYEGRTIIAEGARAEGTITEISKRKTVIVMSSVDASNGEKIYFEPEDIAGRGEKVFERKHYIGIIRKGLTLTF